MNVLREVWANLECFHPKSYSDIISISYPTQKRTVGKTDICQSPKTVTIQRWGLVSFPGFDVLKLTERKVVKDIICLCKNNLRELDARFLIKAPFEVSTGGPGCVSVSVRATACVFCGYLSVSLCHCQNMAGAKNRQTRHRLIMQLMQRCSSI